MKTIETLKAELETAEQAVNNIRQQIRTIADGFTYVVCILSYGSKTWNTDYPNTFFLQELCYDYGSGEDGLVHIYTNNPNLELDHYGCLRIFTLEELPESRRNVSKTAGILSFMLPSTE